MRIMSSLRNSDIATEIYPEAAKMKKQMEYANRRGIPYVILIGSEELASGVATVKDMRSGEQREVSFEELPAAF
jgi:histidyl-tRNA synthetase